MTACCYKFISGSGSAKLIKNWFRFAKVIDKSLLPHYSCSTM